MIILDFLFYSLISSWATQRRLVWLLLYMAYRRFFTAIIIIIIIIIIAILGESIIGGKGGVKVKKYHDLKREVMIIIGN